MTSDLLGVESQLAGSAGGHDGPVRHDRVDALVAGAQGGLVSVSPLFGHSDIARSTRAVIVSDGFTPGWPA